MRMTWLVAIVLAPLLFMVVAVVAVLKLAVLVLRLVFAPALWLNQRPGGQRVGAPSRLCGVARSGSLVAAGSAASLDGDASSSTANERR
jgi:hypothetical protein